MDYLALLHQHDDPVRCECPPDFDRHAAELKFGEFLASLKPTLGKDLEFETGVVIQDASFHSQVFLPLAKGRHATIRFSNFGNMVTVSDDEPVPEALLDSVVTLLTDHGYVYVPANILDRPYTGHNAARGEIRDWWIRYFDWL